MTKEQVAALLGRPDDVGGTSRKYPEPSIYRYGKYELHFGPRADDTLFLIYAEDGDGNGQTILR